MTQETVFACDALGDPYRHNAQLLWANKELLARCDLLEAELATLKEVAKGLRDALRLINSGDHEDKPHSVAGYTLHLWEKELTALVGEEGR